MNIFYLSDNPKLAAKYHNNSHVVKMVLETAQILCTAHRVLDGTEDKILKNGRFQKHWKMKDPEQELYLYKATHINHPSVKWACESKNNYEWLYKLFASLCEEYKYRYGKTHLCETKLMTKIMNPPKNISDTPFTSPPQAMPEEFHDTDSIVAYRNYYIHGKSHLATWTKRRTPKWYKNKEI